MSCGLPWYAHSVAILGVLALAAGTLFFAWTAVRPPAALARDDGREILYVLAGVCFLVAAALWLHTIPES